MRFIIILTLLGLSSGALAEQPHYCSVGEVNSARGEASILPSCSKGESLSKVGPRIEVCKDSVSTVLPVILSAKTSGAKVSISVDTENDCIWGASID
jgi:hypothetical protein